MRETMAKIAGRFRKVDHLVNNAGIVVVKTVEESSVEDWDRVMDVNVRSIFLAVKYLLPALRLAAQPTIVNMGSVSGRRPKRHARLCGRQRRGCDAVEGPSGRPRGIRHSCQLRVPRDQGHAHASFLCQCVSRS